MQLNAEHFRLIHPSYHQWSMDGVLTINKTILLQLYVCIWLFRTDTFWVTKIVWTKPFMTNHRIRPNIWFSIFGLHSPKWFFSHPFYSLDFHNTRVSTWTTTYSSHFSKSREAVGTLNFELCCNIRWSLGSLPLNAHKLCALQAKINATKVCFSKFNREEGSNWGGFNVFSLFCTSEIYALFEIIYEISRTSLHLPHCCILPAS